ncbi:MAG: alpha/beta fold hydrolase [Candidatus Bathyarchaeota archaeon]|nr:MAG: alpha/beta fold hydrolase [Candidatus Bathyarchaeota archaeon]
MNLSPEEGSGIIVENVSFESDGHRLLGRIYRPNSPGKFPAVAICHGYPGDNKNMDLAEELALNGIVTLIFYYRGAWGSSGDFGLKWFDPSARDAVDFLIASPTVDSERVGIIGYSMGAIPLTARLASDQRLKAGVFLAPVADLSLYATGERLEALTSIFVRMGQGKLSGLSAEDLINDLPWLLENQNPVDLLKKVRAPVLFVVGSEDRETIPELCRALFEVANEPKEWTIIEGANHNFLGHRIPLIDVITSWLKGHL